MAKKKTNKRPRYQPLIKLQDGGNGLNAIAPDLSINSTFNANDPFGAWDLGNNPVNLQGSPKYDSLRGNVDQFGDSGGINTSLLALAGGAALTGLIGLGQSRDKTTQNPYNINDTYNRWDDTWSDVASGAAKGASIGGIAGGVGSVVGGVVGGATGFVKDLFQTSKEEEAFNKKQESVVTPLLQQQSLNIAQKRGTNLGANPNVVTSYQPGEQYNFDFENGGYLPKKVNGGNINDPQGTPIGRDATGKIVYTTNPVDTTNRAYYTPNTYRPRTKTNTVDTLINDFNFSRKDANARYSPELLDSIANTTNRFQLGTSSIGEPTLNEFIPNVGARVQLQNGGNISENNGTPIIRKYNGQSHEGNDGGIEVDAQGNPTIMTGNQGIALTESGELNFNGYIFSDNIEYK